MFDTNGSGCIDKDALKVALRALGIDPSNEELSQLVEDHARDSSETVDFQGFFQIMMMKIEEDAEPEDAEVAFELFDKNSNQNICIRDLRSVANELGEDMTDEDLQEMLQGASVRREVGDFSATKSSLINKKAPEYTVNRVAFRQLMGSRAMDDNAFDDNEILNSVESPKKNVKSKIDTGR